MGGREETLRSLGHWSIKVLITQWCGVVLCESWLGRGGGEGEGLCKIQTCQLQARGCDLHIFNEGVRGIQSLMLSQWPYVSPSLPKEGKRDENCLGYWNEAIYMSWGNREGTKKGPSLKRARWDKFHFTISPEQDPAMP